MPNEHKVQFNADGMRIAIVVSRFNDYVTKRLVDGAVDCLMQHGIRESDIDIYWVGGAFELPQLAAKIGREGTADGVVCIGALIRGETIHFDVLATSVATAVEHVAINGDMPVTFGVLTVESMEQAIDRAGGKHGNVGWSSTMSLIELVSHWRKTQ